MKLNVIIADDEQLARKLVANLLESLDQINLVGIYGTGKEAIGAINAIKPDILFLDIRLKDMSGFDVLEKIQVKMPLTIFTTAFDQYAIEAFNIFAFDYLLKPFTEDRFYQSVFKAIESLNTTKGEDIEIKLSGLTSYMESAKNVEYKSTTSRLPVPFGNKTLFVKKKDINYILAANYYIEIYTAKAKYVLRDSMYNIMSELDPEVFVRIHRSSIVNLGQIKELVYSAFGEIDVSMDGERKLRVSKGYRKEFLVKVGVRK